MIADVIWALALLVLVVGLVLALLRAEPRLSAIDRAIGRAYADADEHDVALDALRRLEHTASRSRTRIRRRQLGGLPRPQRPRRRQRTIPPRRPAGPSVLVAETRRVLREAGIPLEVSDGTAPTSAESMAGHPDAAAAALLEQLGASRFGAGIAYTGHGPRFVEVDNPFRREVRPRRGTEGAWPHG